MQPGSEVHATTSSPEWVNDWDLLSMRFQSEAAAYLQVVGVFLILILVKKRRGTAEVMMQSPRIASGIASGLSRLTSGLVAAVSRRPPPSAAPSTPDASTAHAPPPHAPTAQEPT